MFAGAICAGAWAARANPSDRLAARLREALCTSWRSGTAANKPIRRGRRGDAR